jgi:FkbM family methyltransferase
MRNLRGFFQYYKEAIVKRLPFVVNRYGSGRMAVRNRFADLRRHITDEAPVIVDGGANRGDITDLFLWLYPSATLHLFEAHPGCAARLEKKYGDKPNVDVHSQALGDTSGSIDFHISANVVSSSALAPSDVGMRYTGAHLETKKTVSVPQVRMDSVLDTDIDIMKLDLQGYELHALKGCGELLHRTKAIAVEIEFVPIYENQALFTDIDSFLSKEGFRIFNFYELYTQSDGQLSAGDALYLNTRHFPAGTTA